MKAQTFLNSFSNGMMGDIDQHEQPNNTYRYALGGRIIFNETNSLSNSLEQNTKEGKSRAFVNVRGNKFAMTLCEGYEIIGSTDTRNGAVIYSTNGTYGEIGFMEVNDNIHRNGFAKYVTLFNDRNDPNGDRLNFDVDHYINGSYVVYENDFTERVYFVDNYNQKRVINLKAFYKPDGTPYHNQANSCNSSSSYPKYLSVHAFDERMSLVFPRINFVQRIPGRLKSGQYQLMVQYVSKSGHSSVWSQITQAVFETAEKMDGSITIGGTVYPNPYVSNHHNRTMGASNIITEEGMQWKLTGIDTRWDQLRVGYIYHATNESPEDVNEFKIYDITSSELVVDLNSHTGIGLELAAITERFETQLSVGSTGQQENRSWDANIELIGDLTADQSAAKIEPLVRYYCPDKTIEPGFDRVFNPVSNRYDNDPFTNVPVVTKTIETQNFTGDSTQHTIFKDYETYKGQQFSHLFKGYFRGETQPFGLLFRDMKGIPYYVQHIADFTFPEQSDETDKDGSATDWSLTRQNTDGTFDIRIMGAKFSNIRIPTKILYDKFGKLKISSFEIVRTERIVRTAYQGILLNCNLSENGSTETNTDAYIHPMEYWDNSYGLKPAGIGYPNSHVYNGIAGSFYKTDYNSKFPATSFSAAGFFNFHSPDILIEQALGNARATKEQLMAGYVEKDGFVHRAYTEAKFFFTVHSYSKLYKTHPFRWSVEQDHIQNSRGKLGSRSRIELAMLHDQSSIHIYPKFDPDTSDTFDYRPHVQVFFNGDTEARKATQQPFSVVLKLKDWKLIDSVESNISRVTYPIVNWKVTPTQYYGTEDPDAQSESALNTRRYFSTGHYQPITKEILDRARKTYNPDGSVEAFAFDNIEVWGGDCYANLFDFTRMYPEYGNCDKADGYYPDYSTSIICPIESKYNIALIYGRKFAANAVMPQQVSCGAADNRDQLNDGIMPRQPESFVYNKVLLLEGSIAKFFPKPAKDLKQISRQDSTIRFSPKKLYGELEDSYRQKLPGDYLDIDGSFGAIQKLCTGFDYLYVLQEKAFGACLTRADRFIPTDTGQISITSGSAIGGIRYISKIYGTQHPNSVVDYDNKIQFTDARSGKILLFSQAGLNEASDNDFMRDPIAMKSIYMDQPITHKNGKFVDIIGGIDRETMDFITTFVCEGIDSDNMPGNMDRSDELKGFTILFNAKLNKWHSYGPVTPRKYFNVNRYLFTTNPGAGKRNQVYLENHGLYGQWYEMFYPTILEFVVNPSASSAKTFDNGIINVNQEGHLRIKKITCRVNDNIHELVISKPTGSALNPIALNDQIARFMEDSLRFIMFQQETLVLQEKPRLRGHYMNVRIEIDNGQYELDGVDTQVAISTFESKFRVSSPNQYQ